MKIPSMLLDTNVWLDIYDPDRRFSEDSFELVSFMRRNDAELYYVSTSMKDVFFIIASSLKMKARASCERLTEEDALAINEIAWGCVRSMYETGAPILVSPSVLSAAMKLKGLHDDFEDDIVFAAAQMANVDFLVTNDASMVAKSMVPTLTARDMLKYLRCDGTTGMKRYGKEETIARARTAYSKAE